jgi:hypothetical protein
MRLGQPQVSFLPDKSDRIMLIYIHPRPLPFSGEPSVLGNLLEPQTDVCTRKRNGIKQESRTDMARTRTAGAKGGKDAFLSSSRGGKNVLGVRLLLRAWQHAFATRITSPT